MAGVKRKCLREPGLEPEVDSQEAGAAGQAAKRRRVEFEDVTIYSFSRRQGHTCVPSQGGNTLGMEETHSSISVLTVDEHAAERWRTTRDLGGSASGVPGLEAGDEAEAAAMLMLTPCIKTSETTPSPSEADFTSILLPVDSKERRVLLRRAGVAEIDTREKEECREMRVSRQTCGCTCQLYCLPDTCPCAKYNISCQVDRPGFPCSCTAEGCLNKTGRLEFNPVKVRSHFVRTIMRTRLEAARLLQHSPASYLPAPALGYLAHMYSHQEALAASTSSMSPLSAASYPAEAGGPHHHWLPGSWTLDTPWWAPAFSAAHAEAAEAETGNDDQEETDTSDSEEEEEEIYADVIEDDYEEEVLEETVVTDDIQIIPSLVEAEVGGILDCVLASVVAEAAAEEEESAEAGYNDEADEGISSDCHSYCEDASTASSASEAKCDTEEDSSDRSEGFEDGKSDSEDGSEPRSISVTPQSTENIIEAGIHSSPLVESVLA